MAGFALGIHLAQREQTRYALLFESRPLGPMQYMLSRAEIPSVSTVPSSLFPVTQPTWMYEPWAHFTSLSAEGGTGYMDLLGQYQRKGGL